MTMKKFLVSGSDITHVQPLPKVCILQILRMYNHYQKSIYCRYYACTNTLKILYIADITYVQPLSKVCILQILRMYNHSQKSVYCKLCSVSKI